jgi:hypothetical protein
MRITRDELYKEIWNEPATKLAHRYDVSSSYPKNGQAVQTR